MNQIGRTPRTQSRRVAVGGEANDLGWHRTHRASLPRLNDGASGISGDRGPALGGPSLPSTINTPLPRTSCHPAMAADNTRIDIQVRRPESEQRAATGIMDVRDAAANAGMTEQGRQNLWRQNLWRSRELQSYADAASGMTGSQSSRERRFHSQRVGEPPPPHSALHPSAAPDGTLTGATGRRQPYLPPGGRGTRGRQLRAPDPSGYVAGAVRAAAAAAAAAPGGPGVPKSTMAICNGMTSAAGGGQLPGVSDRRSQPLPLPVDLPSGLAASTSGPARSMVLAADGGTADERQRRRPPPPPSPTAAATAYTSGPDGGSASVVRRDGGGSRKAPARRRMHHRGPYPGGSTGGTDGSGTSRQPSSPMHPHVLTGILRTASSVPKLQKYVARYGSQFNNLHICCCLNRLAKAPDARGTVQRVAVQQLLDELGDMLVRLLPECRARELCNVLWVWGKLGYTPKRESWEAMRIALFGVDPTVTPVAASSSSPAAATAPGSASAAVPSAAAASGAESASSSLTVAVAAAQRGRCARESSSERLEDRSMADNTAGSAGFHGGWDGAADPSRSISATVSASRDGLAGSAASPGEAPPQPQATQAAHQGQAIAVAAAATATSTFPTVADGRAPAAVAAAASCTTATAAGKLEHAAPQGLANAAWALSRLRCSDPWAWRRLAECSLAKLHAFVPYDISNLSYAFVVARQHRAHPAHEALMRALAAAAEARLAEFCPQDVSNMLWAYARGDLAQPSLFIAAAPIARAMAADFGQAGLAQVMWAYAAVRVYDAKLLGALAREMLPKLHLLDANSQVMLCWALARFVAAAASATVDSHGGNVAAAAAVPPSAASSSSLGSISLLLAARVRGGFVDPLVRLHMAGGQAAVAAAAGAAAAAVASQGGNGDGSGGGSVLGEDTSSSACQQPSIRMGTLARAYVEDLTALNSSSSNPAVAASASVSAALAPDWAVDLLIDGDDAGYGSIAYENVTVAAAGGQRPAAATAVTLAQSQVEALAAAAEEAQAVLSEMPPQLLPALVESLRPRIDTLDTGSLAVFLWALATLGYAATQFFSIAAAALTPRLRNGQVATPFLTHIAWAFTAAGVYDSDLYDALAAAAAAVCAAGPPAAATSLALANVLWALGSAGHYDAELYGRVGRVVTATVAAAPTFDGTGDRQGVNRLAMVMLACAYTGHEDAELYGMVSVALRRAGAAALEDKSLANICWALAVVHHADLGLLSEMFEDVARRDVEALGVRGCTQLFHCALWLQDLVPGGEEVVALLSRDVLEVGRANFLELAKDSNVSDFQAYVFNALDSMGLTPSLEVKTSDQLFSLDVTVTLGCGGGSSGGDSAPGTMRIAVEANGPQHYLRTQPTALEGSTRLRCRLLRARGWVPLHVHWRDWQELGGDVLRQRRYLRARLGELLQLGQGVQL